MQRTSWRVVGGWSGPLLSLYLLVVLADRAVCHEQASTKCGLSKEPRSYVFATEEQKQNHSLL